MRDVAQLFDEHHRALYRYLVRFCGDADLAADAAQEAFVRLVERPPAVPGGERAWLFKVATNVVFERSRAHVRRTRLLARAPARVGTGDETPTPYELVEADDRRRLVASALASLSDKERSALLMREEGFSHREIAEAVGTTVGSVGTLVARALDKLAAKLGLDRQDV
jgi:RNA polymerase sigma factor (sigma-70 family)